MSTVDFAELADLLPEPMLLVSSDGRVLAVNRSLSRLLGLPRHEVVGQSLTDFAAGPAEAVLRHLQDCARTRDLLLGSLVLERPGGPAVSCRTEGAVLQPRNDAQPAVVLMRLIPKENSIARFVALNQKLEETRREVARRRQAEQALYDQREELLVTLTSIGDAVLVTDRGGKVVFLNPVAESLTGWGLEEARGKPLPEVFHIVNEHTRQPAENPVDKVLRDGVTVGLANHTLLIARDGTEWPIDDSAAPMRQEDGRLAGVVLVFRDITDRRRTEEALRESEGRFRAIFLQANVGIAQIDPEGRFVLANERFCEIVGRSVEELHGLTDEQITHPDDRPRSRDEVRAVLAGAGARSMEKRYLGQGGDEVWVKNALSAIHSRGGEPLYCIAVVEDIRRRKELERDLQRRVEDLVRADQQKNQFLAMLSHELRNPLAPIQSGLDLLIVEGESGAIVELMKEQLEHLVRLVDDLLDVSRIVRGRIELRKETVLLSSVLTRALELAAPLIREQEHELRLSVSPKPVWLHGDSVRLVQIVANLLTNAAKYTDRGGEIRLTAVRNGDTADIRVSDTGIGIAPELLPCIFDLFMQADASLDRTRGGLGIGLTLVRNLVEQHGGRVAAFSEGPGRGSEFVVSLPVVSDQGARGAPPAARAPAAASRRVLVVDDNHAAAQLLSLLLQKLGDHAVELAHDGLAALEAARTFRPNLILLDIGLPHLDGYEVARRLRALPEFQDTLLVALTGYGQPEDRQQALEAGCDVHLTKPPAVDELRRVLERRRPAPR